MPTIDYTNPSNTQPALFSPRVATLLLTLSFMLFFAAAILFFSRPPVSDKQSYARAVLLGEIMMHSQRVAKAAQIALTGTDGGFKQLQESDQAIDAGLKILAQGGQYQGQTIPQSTAESLAALKEVQKIWGKSHRAAKTILEAQEELMGVSRNLTKMQSMTSAVEEIGQQVSTLYVQNGASPREVSASSQLLMLLQRLAKNSHELLGAQGIEPETAFLLGRDADVFLQIINGFIYGSQELRLSANKVPEIRSKLSELQTAFAEYHKLNKQNLGQLVKLIGAKQAESLIFSDSEQLKTSLEKLQKTYHPN